MSAQQSDVRWWVHTLLLAAIVGLAGAFFVMKEPGRENGPPAFATQVRDLTQAVQGLNMLLEKVALRVEQENQLQAPHSSPDRTSAADAERAQETELLSSLKSSIQELVASVHDLRSSTAELASTSGNLKEPGGIADRSKLKPLFAESDEQRDHEHFFWTYQQVLDAYGYPDMARAQQGGGMKWDYVDSVQGTLVFWFAEGRVVRVLK